LMRGNALTLRAVRWCDGENEASPAVAPHGSWLPGGGQMVPISIPASPCCTALHCTALHSTVSDADKQEDNRFRTFQEAVWWGGSPIRPLLPKRLDSGPYLAVFGIFGRSWQLLGSWFRFPVSGLGSFCLISTMDGLMYGLTDKLMESSFIR
jgi:hypothetical protein